MKRYSAPANHQFNVLLLGYDPENLMFVDRIMELGGAVWHTSDPVSSVSDFDYVISYGYRHMIPKKVIDSASRPIVNLHISVLPWNRGAHPNFWAHADATPSGVTIHVVDEGLDTGPILLQREVKFQDSNDTFTARYSILNLEIQDLLLENLEKIFNSECRPVPQIGKGTTHRTADLPADFSGWDSNVQTEIERLKRLGAI